MQLPTQLPFGILCILFAHFTQATAVCTTLPCNENAPVYGVGNVPPYSGAVLSALAGESSIGSTTSPAAIVSVNPLFTKAATEPSIPSVAVPSTSSTSTPVYYPTTASSVTPTSTASINPPAATPTSTPSVEPTVNSSPPSSTKVSTVTPLSITASSSNAISPVNQSSTASPVSSAASNSTASVIVPASITQCGSCRVLADQVQVYYWPTASVKNDCARGASGSPFQTGVRYASNASSIQALAPQMADSPTTTVVDGHTL